VPTPARVPLRTFAQARSGDKGAHANVGVWVADDPAYAVLVREVTVERVAAHLGIPVGQVDRAINVVLRGVLGAGGAAGLDSDAQAKTYSQALLALEIEGVG
jgi:hypothetical protein